MNQGGETTRRGSRFSAGIPAVLRYSDREYDCLAHDLSRSGVLLTGNLPIAVGTETDLTLKAPSGGLEVRLTARAVRELPGDGEGSHQVAFEFIDMIETQRNALEALIARVLEANVSGPLEALRPGASPPDIRKALDQIPVPQKIALAVRAGVREREYLRQDTRGAVLEALARNPNLLAADVRALVASPHILPTTLEFVTNDARWKGDEEIQLALLCHPKIPFPAAQQILETLAPPVLRKVLHRAGVQSAVRERVVRRLGRG